MREAFWRCWKPQPFKTRGGGVLRLSFGLGCDHAQFQLQQVAFFVDGAAAFVGFGGFQRHRLVADDTSRKHGGRDRLVHGACARGEGATVFITLACVFGMAMALRWWGESSVGSR
jgi:hypothetical protein